LWTSDDKAKKKSFPSSRKVFIPLPQQCFIRIGSNTTPTTEKVSRNQLNVATVTDIENNAQTTLNIP
jgi:hypothetical protein